MRSANFNAVIGESDADVKERVERLRARQVAKANEAAVDGMLTMVTSPDSASGTPEQVIEKLERMRELGCEYAILYFPEAAYDRSGIELFEREVIPALARRRALAASCGERRQVRRDPRAARSGWVGAP